jgi:hypothetical protein
MSKLYPLPAAGGKVPASRRVCEATRTTASELDSKHKKKDLTAEIFFLK